jgi:Flp pilus assembly protein TadG
MKFIGDLARALRPLGAGEAGNALIEFALAVPILMILVLVTADYASLANDKVNLEAATRAGAQYARKNTGASGATVAAYGNFPAGVTPSVTIVCTCVDNSAVSCNGTCTGGDTRVVQYIQVSATQNFTPWFPYAGFAFPATLSASTSLRIK